jgi:NDP-sugar pyrophosphorylase family protein
MITTAVIPVAGHGKRLRPLTNTKPKALIEVGGVPMSQRVVRQAEECGVRRIIFVVGYKGDEVISHFEGRRPAQMEYLFVSQPILDGTGGALKCIKGLVSSDEFIVAFGNSYFAPGSVAMVANHDGTTVVGIVSVEDPERYGVVIVNDVGNVLDIEEKPIQPKSNFVIAGIYKFNNAV